MEHQSTQTLERPEQQAHSVQYVHYRRKTVLEMSHQITASTANYPWQMDKTAKAKDSPRTHLLQTRLRR